jgi:serine/threonine protein kinase
MVIDGVVEKMGSWEVNLNDYAKKEDLANKVDAQDGYSLVPDALIERLENIQPNAEQNFIKSVSSNFTVTDGFLELISLPSSIDLSSSTVIQNLNKALEGKVDAEEGKSLVADDLIEKLIILDPNAQANVIDDVSDEFTVTGKTLSVNAIDASKITNLSQLKEISDLISSVNTNTTNIANLNSIISQTEEDIATLRGEFRDTYVTKEKHTSDINALWEVLTWQELPE